MDTSTCPESVWPRLAEGIRLTTAAIRSRQTNGRLAKRVRKSKGIMVWARKLLPLDMDVILSWGSNGHLFSGAVFGDSCSLRGGRVFQRWEKNSVFIKPHAFALDENPSRQRFKV